MNAKDLRIGNLVHYMVEDELDDRKSWNEINIIDAEDILYLEACEVNKWQHSYSPIPLTEEWLEKLGFKVGGKDFGKYIECASRIIISLDYERNGYQIDSHAKLEYVHQLQNLNYARTGEELEYHPAKKSRKI